MSGLGEGQRVIQKLKNLHQENKNSLSFNKLRIIVAIERMIKRLESHSILAKHLVFKGGFVLIKCFGSPRFTRDLDALGMDIAKNDVKDLVPQALMADLKDGFWFGDIKCKELSDQGDYGGYRFDMAFQIGDVPKPGSIKKMSRIHFDVGFGDVVEKIKTERLEPLVEGGEEFTWSVYPIEYIISEKLQTFVARGELNSRGKDIFDIVSLYIHINNQITLSKAIQATFSTRQTELPKSLKAFAEELDISYIESSWKSVDLMGGGEAFDVTWQKFLVILGKLDKQ